VVVNRYCVVNVAVYVVDDAGAVTICEIAPASLQVENTSRVPVDDCGDVVAIVCCVPGVQLNTCGDV
jgi:hypothetical protein